MMGGGSYSGEKGFIEGKRQRGKRDVRMRGCTVREREMRVSGWFKGREQRLRRRWCAG